jgi:O-antigen/teichoic acid export membrane protein
MIILSFMYGLEEASVYSVYALVSSGLSLFITALYSAFSPSFGNLLAQGDDEGSKRVFEIFQFLFNMFNTLIIMCMLYLIIPFVRLYTAGATDIDYINPLLAILLSFNGLVFAYRIPYNVVVSTCGFFKETWKQPVITACLSLAISIFLGKYNYSLILIGPIVFYIVNFVYQYFRLKGLVQHLISNSVFLMAIISIAGFILGLIAVDYASLPGGVAAWIAQAVIGLLASTGFIVLLSALLLRQELAASYNYLKSIVYRRM